MTESDDVAEALQKFLKIDVRDPAIRQRAWKRLHVWREIAEDCERDGNHSTAAFLRRVCQQAVSDRLGTEKLISIALIAGPDRPARVTRKRSR